MPCSQARRSVKEHSEHIKELLVFGRTMWNLSPFELFQVLLSFPRPFGRFTLTLSFEGGAEERSDVSSQTVVDFIGPQNLLSTTN